jgi:hypothetical protein
MAEIFLLERDTANVEAEQKESHSAVNVGPRRSERSLRSLEDIMKKCAIMLVFSYAVVTFLTVTPLAAGTLNADGVKKILEGRTWVEKGLENIFSETFWE